MILSGLINERFLAGKPPRLIFTSPAGRDVAIEISAVNNSQAFSGFTAKEGAVRAGNGKCDGHDHADQKKCTIVF
jgi:hypothetical protein